MRKIFICENLSEIILVQRNNKVSLREISRITNISRPVIANFLKEHNITTERFVNTFNEDFFACIDNEHKAYCLGLWFTDGSVDTERGRILLGLTDKDSIYKVKCCMNYTGDIRVCHKAKEKNSKHKIRYWLEISSKKLANDLAKTGCVPRKSLILDYPYSTISEEFVRHFIRGAIDGDGCISCSKDNQWSVSITGTREFLSGINEQSRFKGRISYASKTNKNTWQWRIRRNETIINLLDWLYQDATIYIDRKKVLADRCLADLRSRI